MKVMKKKTLLESNLLNKKQSNRSSDPMISSSNTKKRKKRRRRKKRKWVTREARHTRKKKKKKAKLVSVKQRHFAATPRPQTPVFSPHSSTHYYLRLYLFKPQSIMNSLRLILPANQLPHQWDINPPPGVLWRLRPRIRKRILLVDGHNLLLLALALT